MVVSSTLTDMADTAADRAALADQVVADDGYGDGGACERIYEYWRWWVAEALGCTRT